MTAIIIAIVLFAGIRFVQGNRIIYSNGVEGSITARLFTFTENKGDITRNALSPSDSAAATVELGLR